MQEIHVLISLPAGGKTWLGNIMHKEIPNSIFIDDPSSIDDLKNLTCEALITAHPFWCEPVALARLENQLTELYPEAKLVKHYFENNPEQCRENARLRNRQPPEFSTLNRLSRIYKVPENVTPIPVWKPPSAY